MTEAGHNSLSALNMYSTPSIAASTLTSAARCCATVHALRQHGLKTMLASPHAQEL